MADIHPSGTFNDAKILDHGFDQVGQNKSLRFWVKFETTEGTIFGNFYLTEKAAEYTVPRIALMGYRGDNPGGDLADGSYLRDNLVQITVEHEEYEGKLKAVVAFVNENHSVGGPTRSEDAAQAANAFSALFKREAQKLDDEDVPF